MRYADKAWLTIGAVALGAEILAPRGELLSQGVDRYLERYPLTTRLVVIYLALHLLNEIHPRLDPLHQLSTALGR